MDTISDTTIDELTQPVPKEKSDLVEKPQLIRRNKSFGGWTEFYRHFSKECAFEMRFSVFVPPQAEKRRVPILYWLPDLTSSEETFMVRVGAQRSAARYGLMLVVPDTSPRGIPGLEEFSTTVELGEGAGFYVDATQAKWARHFQMYSYVTKELPSVIHTHFPGLPSREGISGYSMGGHGALVAALRQPRRYLSVSVFAPICCPSKSPWGRNALQNYLGAEEAAWLDYDATHLATHSKVNFPILIDQGTDDPYLEEQLRLDVFVKACEEAGFPLNTRMQHGYDHSHYFVSSFVADHIEYHAEKLNLF